jgi:universal stress protein E
MRKLDKILVVLEPQQEEQPALNRAMFLAEATGASLHLFMCAYDTAIGIASFLSGRQKNTFIKTILDGTQVLVDRLTEEAKGRGITSTNEVIWDRHPTDAILQVAANDFDLMMKHAKPHLRAEVMFHHMEWNLMRYGPCPVMLVKDGQWDDVGQVLAAIDAAPESELHQALNKAILDRAQFLAKTLDFELHLVSAYPAPPVFAPVSAAAEQVSSYRHKMSQMVIGNLGELGLEYGVPVEHQHAVEGPVDWVISQVSEDLVAEFVVMGNVSREGMSGISIGSSAESILDQLHTNVLMVRVNRSPG